MIKKILLFTCVILALHVSGYAQDWMTMLDSGSATTNFTAATFKTTRLVNTHTLETLGKRTLDFRISHRFNTFNTGAYHAYGLDGPANIRLGLEYSYEGTLMAGIGRSSTPDKMWDGFLKYRLYRQTEDNAHPFSVTLFAGMYYTNEKDVKDNNGFDKYEFFSSRLSYAYEIIVGRKFNSHFSFQVAPFFVHYNLAEKFTDKNDMYGVTGALRYKFSKRAAITGEYSYRINKYSLDPYYDSLGIGLEIETGGHVFQVHLTNSTGMVENQFFAHTMDKWGNAGIRLGFNISRVFTL